MYVKLGSRVIYGLSQPVTQCELWVFPERNFPLIAFSLSVVTVKIQSKVIESDGVLPGIGDEVGYVITVTVSGNVKSHYF